jgi:hypothetical protein
VKRYALFALVPLAACAQTSPPADTPETPPARLAGQCDAAAVQDLVGKPASSELGADALTRSHAAVMRWLRPGQIVTMEYRADRLNLNLDAQNVVARIGCG